MTRYGSLVASFAFIIILSVTLNILALLQVLSIADKVENIYHHPFAVSNASQTIESRILAMHRDMKDIVLTTDPSVIPQLLSQIGQHEQEALSQFAIVSERFLGDKSEISRVYQLFLDWRPIRNEVLALHSLNKHNEAAEITRERGAEHVKSLQNEVRAFTEFAKAKAEKFHEVASQDEQRSIVTISVLSLITFLLSTLIAVLMVRARRKSEADIALQSHLIDQNIMLASLDLEGKITKISNALCRFLHSTKDNLVGTQSHFFMDLEDKSNDISRIWRLLKTGKGWEGEICCKDADGVLHCVNSTLLPVFDDHFRVVGYTNIIQDSTDKKLSITDALTTLPNRRSFDEVFERVLQEAKAEKKRVTLAILDVDHFKLFNDNYGHHAGDEALSLIGKSLQESFQREGEHIFRIGGEEFAVLLTEQNAEQASAELERIRSNIEGLQIPHEYNSASNYLTLSVGGCIVDCHSLSTNELYGLTDCNLYEKADKALYQAKNSRNTVVINVFCGTEECDEDGNTVAAEQAA